MLFLALAFLAAPAAALASPVNAAADARLPGLVVSATRRALPADAVPAAVDRVDGDEARAARPRVSLSEALGRVPGVAVQDRQNYAQDLQVTSRGFGGRATFGVRGVRLVTDGIPATMPDGQGQAAAFDLDTVGRIEVLRGPLAYLYGNASGGLIQSYTAEGRAGGEWEAAGYRGAFGARRVSAQVAGDASGVSHRLAVSRFETDGFRDRSAARRDLFLGRLATDMGGGRLVLVASAIDQPESQDPLGLTRAQFAANPRQSDAAATLFDTRKSVRQGQAGAVHSRALGQAWSMQARAYAGTRDVLQFLAQPGDGPLASGGVVELGRRYGGAALQATHEGSLAGRPLQATLAVEQDRLDERRRGYVNVFGSAGDLRRDEDDTVDATAVLAMLDWEPAGGWRAMGGIRHSRVAFRVRDRYVTSANPDDSGSVTYARTTAAAGLTWAVTPTLRAYASAGEGFETPTFTELAYRNGGSGPNLALRPATSRQSEAGIKGRWGAAAEWSAAVFSIATRDEIVTDASSGGRTTFRNAARTKRQGVELAARGRIAPAWEGAIACTWLDARFQEAFSSGSPPVAVPAGSFLPGVARATANLEISYRLSEALRVGVEARGSSRVFVNDANADAAAGHGVASAFVAGDWAAAGWRVRPYLRVDNLFERRYAGSVIVAEARGRFFEPAPGRSVSVGVSITDR